MLATLLPEIMEKIANAYKEMMDLSMEIFRQNAESVNCFLFR